MSKKLVAIDAPEKYLSITWQVNNFCNYSCSYCNPGNWIGDQRNEEDSQLYINNLREIVHRYQQEGYKNYKFFFSGGEPTAWRNFMPILAWIREELPGATIAVNTNLSRPLGWWKKHYHYFDDIIASSQDINALENSFNVGNPENRSSNTRSGTGRQRTPATRLIEETGGEESSNSRGRSRVDSNINRIANSSSSSTGRGRAAVQVPIDFPDMEAEVLEDLVNGDLLDHF